MTSFLEKFQNILSEVTLPKDLQEYLNTALKPSEPITTTSFRRELLATFSSLLERNPDIEFHVIIAATIDAFRKRLSEEQYEDEDEGTTVDGQILLATITDDIMNHAFTERFRERDAISEAQSPAEHSNVIQFDPRRRR